METSSDPVTWLVAGSSGSSWFWLPHLAEVNQLLTAVLTILGIGLAGLKIYNEWKRTKK